MRTLAGNNAQGESGIGTVSCRVHPHPDVVEAFGVCVVVFGSILQEGQGQSPYNPIRGN